MRGTPENPLHTRAKRDHACSACGAKAGESCVKRQGGTAWPPHKARLDEARKPRGAWEGVPLGVLSDLADEAGFDPAECC